MKKKFSRSLMLNKKSVASLAVTKNVKRQIIGGKEERTYDETCPYNCIPETVYPSCGPTCEYSDCHCTNGDCYTDRQGWGDCS
ncbi:hypothetical protein [uncultured Kordia sp.]|uniref:hypothetical protein n=1 Tax=uncultured Kordia sp. TaxID=507699 RepID=UPI00262449EF|nr:hypothetical protein [uncultured Kordia sp.]